MSLKGKRVGIRSKGQSGTIVSEPFPSGSTGEPHVRVDVNGPEGLLRSVIFRLADLDFLEP